MPRLTNRTNLNPGPAPNVPPWWWLDCRTTGVWLRVSIQSLANWRFRHTGPPWRECRSTRIWYRHCDVAAWIDEGEPAAVARIRAYLAAHEKTAGGALWRLPDAARAHALSTLAKAATASPDALDALCATLDRIGAFGRPPKAPKGGFVPNPKAHALIGLDYATNAN